MSEPTPPDPARRSLLCAALGAGAAAVGVALLTPPLVVLVAPAVEPGPGREGDGLRWIDLGPAARFGVGAAPRRVVLRTDRRDAWRVETGVALGTIWVQRPKTDTFLIHSATCTHLGCAVDFREAAFICPCHGARFAADGGLAPMPDGAPNPAPRGLDALAWRLVAGVDHLEVAWQRFALNVPDQRPVGGGAA
jgi:Rieske Fe-S protein